MFDIITGLVPDIQPIPTSTSRYIQIQYWITPQMSMIQLEIIYFAYKAKDKERILDY